MVTALMMNRCLRRYLTYGLILTLQITILYGLWSYAGRDIQTQFSVPPPKMECVSYTPFRGDEHPHQFVQGLKIPKERFEEDIKLLSDYFSCVRVYSATGLADLLPILKQYDMKIMLGIWVGRGPVDNQREIIKALILAALYPKQVASIIVGNEALLRKDINGIMLSALIYQVRAALPKTKITYADVWEFWQKNPEVAPSVDFVTIHILPYWENDPASITAALDHVKFVRESIVSEFPDKEIFIGETGWPSYGRVREGAEPSVLNQARFVRGFVDLAHRNGWHYNLIEAFDQPWKKNSEGGVGGYWGLWSENREIKAWKHEFVSEVPNWQNLFLYSLILLMLFGLLLFYFNVALNRLLLILSICFSIATFLILYQLRQDILLTRNINEALFSGYLLFFGLSVVVCRAVFQSLQIALLPIDKTIDGVLNRKITPQFAMSFLYWISLFLALSMTLIFVFDSRYRMYPLAFFILLSLFWAGMRFHDCTGKSEGLVFVVSLISLVVLIFIETPLNSEAIIWAASFLCMLLPILRSIRFKQLIRDAVPLLKILAFVFLGLFLAILIRYQFLESEFVSESCALSDRPLWCSWLSVLGVSIHFGLFKQMAILFAFAALFAYRQWPLNVSLVLLSMALVLYGAESAAYWLVLILLLSSNLRLNRQPFESNDRENKQG